MLLLLALMAFAPVTEFAQRSQRVLSNADIVRMIREGTPESEIVCVIGESEADYDVSAKSLIELKQAGATSPVLDAMLRRAGALDSREPAPGAPVSPKVTTLIVGGTRVALTRAKYSGKAKHWLFRTGSSYFYLEGAASNVRFRDASAEFEVSLPFDIDPSARLVLLKLEREGDRRTVESGSRKGSVSILGFPKESVVPVNIKNNGSYIAADGAKYKLYRVRPVNPLAPGEYSLTRFQAPIQFYDFAID